MRMSIEVDTLDDIVLTEEDRELCRANVTHVTVDGSVSVNYETFKISIGGDVPTMMPWLKYLKYLINNVNWMRESIRNNMEANYKKNLGVSMRQEAGRERKRIR